MPDVCIGCGLTIDDLGNLVADTQPLPEPFPTGQQAAPVYCDSADGGLKVVEEGTLASMTALTGPTGFGDPVPAGFPIRVKAGTSHIHTNSFGLASIVFPTPFPNGILGLSVMPTTGSGAGFASVSAPTGTTVGTAQIQLWGISGSSVVLKADLDVTVSWVAVGW